MRQNHLSSSQIDRQYIMFFSVFIGHSSPVTTKQNCYQLFSQLSPCLFFFSLLEVYPTLNTPVKSCADVVNNSLSLSSCQMLQKKPEKQQLEQNDTVHSVADTRTFHSLVSLNLNWQLLGHCRLELCKFQLVSLQIFVLNWALSVSIAWTLS